MAIASSLWSFIVVVTTFCWGTFIAWNYFRNENVSTERALITAFILILFQVVEPKGFKKAKEFLVIAIDVIRNNKKNDDAA